MASIGKIESTIRRENKRLTASKAAAKCAAALKAHGVSTHSSDHSHENYKVAPFTHEPPVTEKSPPPPAKSEKPPASSEK